MAHSLARHRRRTWQRCRWPRSAAARPASDGWWTCSTHRTGTRRHFGDA
jgi:hypothetical protein